MATTELSSGPRPRNVGRRLPTGSVGAWLRVYVGIWTATLAAAALVALAGQALALPTRHVLGLALTPERNPPPHLGHILALAAHNTPIAAWPVLLGLTGAAQHPLARRIADGLVLACILVDALPVGAALGAYGTPLIAYVPQLPLEWAAVALGASSWLLQRRHGLTGSARLASLVLIAGALLCAATLETAAVPHQSGSRDGARDASSRARPGTISCRGG